MEEVLAVSDMLEAIKAENFTGDIYEEAATRFGCETTWVKDRDYLHRLTKPVQHLALRSGLPAGHLRELAKVGDPQEQMPLACDSIGAPSHAFPHDPKKAKLAEWQQQLQDRYFVELADGKVQRWPLSQLKNQVARVQLSLRLIPWEFDKPVKYGATDLANAPGAPTIPKPIAPSLALTKTRPILMATVSTPRATTPSIRRPTPPKLTS